MKFSKLLISLLVLSPFWSFSQEVQITNIQMKGPDMVITYNLIDERIDRSYSMHLYTSLDNFIQPVEKVSGDVGVDIPVGANKTIVWNAKEELGEFNDGIKLEIKGQIYVPFIELDGVERGMILKRGKMTDIRWTGGRGDNILNVDLYQGEKLVRGLGELPNTGNANLKIPSNVPPGKGYRYKISDERNRDEVVYSPSFEVKRKFPLLIKVGSGITIGVFGYYLIKSLIPVNEPDISSPPFPEQ
ncbi:hypothetical protein [Ekhidna sp.]|uniref:hypothetical protein n=1 Tax=Ekhidna sp. TaxID=2608089 RepID=UPI003CCC3AAE